MKNVIIPFVCFLAIILSSCAGTNAITKRTLNRKIKIAHKAQKKKIKRIYKQAKKMYKNYDQYCEAKKIVSNYEK